MCKLTFMMYVYWCILVLRQILSLEKAKIKRFTVEIIIITSTNLIHQCIVRRALIKAVFTYVSTRIKSRSLLRQRKTISFYLQSDRDVLFPYQPVFPHAGVSLVSLYTSLFYNN